MHQMFSQRSVGVTSEVKNSNTGVAETLSHCQICMFSMSLGWDIQKNTKYQQQKNIIDNWFVNVECLKDCI